MLYSLYEYYSHSNLNLYEVRNHYLEHFYYQKHSKDSADKVLKSIVDSSKVGRLIQESCKEGSVPSYEDFLNTIYSMFKFMFKDNETIALATMEAALVWNIKVSERQLVSQEEFKQDIIKVFDKLELYGEMDEAEYHSVAGIPTVDAEIVEEPRNDLFLEHKASKFKVWSLSTFVKEFGRMKVASFVNKTTGDRFKTCVCTNYKARTFIAFSPKIGVLSSREIKEIKDELIVVRKSNGKYVLTKKSSEAWEDVDV